MAKNCRHCLERSDLLYLVACWNSDPYLIETDEQIDQIWEDFRIYGFHEIEQDSEDYLIACAQLDLDSIAHYRIFESNIFTCKIGGLLD